jgi:putative two-component system response regulator
VLVLGALPETQPLLQAALQAACELQLAPDVEAGLALARSGTPPALLLLDAAAPGLDAPALCQRLQADAALRELPAIVLGAPHLGEGGAGGEHAHDCGASEAAVAALQQGAADHVARPCSPALLQARVMACLRSRQAGERARAESQRLRDELAQRTAQLTAIQDVTTLVMASMAETRGSETSNHIRRTQYYVKALGWRLCTHPKFAATLTPTTIELLFRSAALHDIGKAGIPDRILLKPGKLSPEEFEIMKTHTTLGRDALTNAKRALGVEVCYLHHAREIAYSHHEKWDGSGYPEGLAGDAIPISGRLMALADVYDALISRRLHKEAMSHEQAIAIIRQTRGRHFDPDVVDAFLAIEDHFKAIAIAYADSPDDLRKKEDYLGIAQV